MPNGKPNILVIWHDDIGISNLRCYSNGLMGYRTQLPQLLHGGDGVPANAQRVSAATRAGQIQR
jgi:arylsulfatase A-like enzyme